MDRKQLIDKVIERFITNDQFNLLSGGLKETVKISLQGFWVKILCLSKKNLQFIGYIL